MKHRKFNHILFLISLLTVLLLSPVLSRAQTDSLEIQNDSLNSTKDSLLTRADSLSVTFYTNSLDNLRSGKIRSIDSTLTYFHQYNAADADNRMYASLGNIGLATNNRIFSPTLSVHLNMNEKAFKPYMFSNKDVRYYKLIKPYTNLHYVLGAAKEQNLDVTFTRYVSKHLLLGVQYSLINSPGHFKNQKSNNNNVYFTAQYFTENKRYGLIANYLHNKLVVQENGGLLYDSIFQQHLETDSKVIPVQLTTAQNLIKSSSFYIEQYFNLLKPLKNKNTSRKIDPGNISYTFQYLKSQAIYSDQEPNADFYNTFPAVFDSLSTFDSNYRIRIRNRFEWSNKGYNKDKLSNLFYLFGGIAFSNIKQHLATDSINKTYNETNPYGGLRLNLFKRSILNARIDYTLGGYHSGDFKLEASLDQYLGSEEKNVGRILINFQLVNRMPDWFLSYYHSNRFNWDLNLKKEHILELKGEYQYKGLKAGVKMTTIQHFTFLNDSVKPQQLNNTGSLLEVYTEGNFLIHHWGINFRLVHQSTTLQQSIHLPLFTGKLDLYYKNWVFKKAAKLQTGFQLYYFTAYFSDAYMPELRQYYLQNDQKIGNYLFADAYATLKVKTFRFFLKANNLLGYLGKYQYFESPHYPALTPGFYLGVNWRFHN